MAPRYQKKVHVLRGIGKQNVMGRESYWAFLSVGMDLPDSIDTPPEKFSRVDDRFVITSDSGKDDYLGELLGEGWSECKRCASVRYCDAWDGIGRRMEHVPLGICREGGRVDGDERQLIVLGLLGPEDVRRIVSGSSAILDAVSKLFGFVSIFNDPMRGAPVSPEILAASAELGIRWPATREQIQEAYKAAAFRYHPDNLDHGSSAKFVAITQARDLLLRHA
jgi:hypothetical protein